jgi:fructokinase
VTNSGNWTIQIGDRAAPSAPIVAIGEVLWDIFPESLRLGGAPLNFAAHAKRLGYDAVLVSALGGDELGERAAGEIAALGLPMRLVGRSANHPTGTAVVCIGSGGQVDFRIMRPAAYDEIRLSTEELLSLSALGPAWIYYGTLFASSPNGQETLGQLWNALPQASRFYDVNLRDGLDTAAVIPQLLSAADVVKLNESEAQVISRQFDLPGSIEAFCRQASKRFGWRGVAVTLGERGCVVLYRGEFAAADGLSVEVADTVGAGDAFSAAFLHGLIHDWPAAEIAGFANRVGALIASRPGAIPAWDLAEADALGAGSGL